MILASGQIENLDIFESFFRQLRLRQKGLGKVDLGSGFIHKAHGVGCIGGNGHCVYCRIDALR